ncbi:MAG TPA: cytochrome c3 family protein [Pirellulales bacterium]|nr:cytochrome c3 family protein [Pirellulales bacterium]
MSQVFSRMTNVVSRVTLIGSILGAAFLMWVCLMYSRSSYGTDGGVVREQPVPFSHQHHVGILAIDCRYCHTSVEHAAYAGMPATKTCMNCHSQMWVGSEMLKPVRASYSSRQPLRWRRVYNLPGFVYFEHGIHVQKGIGCSSCHGRIDEMPLTYQVPSLLMEWCLDCHRHPEREVRPRGEIFNIQYQKPADQETLGRQLCDEYDIKDPLAITSCSVCHR